MRAAAIAAAALFLATGTAHAEYKCDDKLAIKYKCGDKLFCVYIGRRGPIIDLETGKHVSSRLFESGPRGGLYYVKAESKCLGGL
jgi:hypothetical protein